MSMCARNRTIGLACVLFAGLAASANLGFAGEVSEDQIVKALKPASGERLTRSLTTTPANAARKAEEERFVGALRNRVTRSLTTDEREKIATIAKEKPSIDLEINFDYNSANINSQAIPTATTLGNALTKPELKDGIFVLAGHTDAKGSAPYNQDLSERRADAIKRFLVEKHNIDASRLVTVGYGKSKLKDGEHPLSGENRRVQIVNMADK